MAVPTLKRCRGQVRNRKSHSAQHPQRKKAIGTLIQDSLFPMDSRVAAVELHDSETSREYSVELWPHNGVMVVSHSTERCWLLNMDEIVDLAVVAGIDRRAD